VAIVEEELVSLLNLAGGAAIERFDEELKRALQNIADPNTALGAREIKLVVKVQPTDMQRNICKVSFQCVSKILPLMSVQTQFYVGIDPKRGAVAVEYNPKQIDLFPKQVVDPSKVVDFQERKEVMAND
jgi:hypothetical protein